MKLVQLRYLVAVAENDFNITQAARVLHAAQPGVSKQLKQLEDELGFQLFERKGRALIRPTPAGNKVIDRASQIVRQARSIKALASELRKDDAGALSIATTHTRVSGSSPDAATTWFWARRSAASMVTAAMSVSAEPTSPTDDTSNRSATAVRNSSRRRSARTAAIDSSAVS